MSDIAIVLPMLANALLAIVLYFLLGLRKKQASREGSVDETRRAIYSDAWPESVQQVNNCIRNQFELPILFYVLCFMLWGLNAVNVWVLIAAWGFVVLRYWHAYVHIGTNFLPLRRRLFTFATLIVIGLWIMVVGHWFITWRSLQ